ncbi:MAG: aldehyde dehydrogenase family protein [Campylobacteraceae bacterium]|jgi:aldehyde dehydrogenase (NAD+)|nr:aldehyde dehydrogenase family protein [Campylobacteraceae bacterium]
MIHIDKVYINGEFVKPHGTKILTLINPDTLEPIGKVTLCDKKDAAYAIKSAKEAFKTFSKTSIKERAEILQRLHDAMSRREEELNAAAIQEYGSPITATRGRTRFAKNSFLTIRNKMNKFKFEQILEDGSKILKAPLGVTAAISPWNANYTHICQKIAPAIAAGCTVVCKPSEYSAIETQILCECFDEAQLPKGVVNIVNGIGEEVGSYIVKHKDIALINFTGSTKVGREISKNAAKMIKRTILELGGKSPNIILDDANLNTAVPNALKIAFSNSGQACHAGSRLFVPESKFELICKMLIESLQKIKIGNIYDEKCYIGPLINQMQFDRVQSYIKSGIEDGAKLLTGGLGKLDGFKGYYTKPTIFIHVKPSMKIAHEEIFGPVLCVFTYKNEEEAIELANDTVYGLAGYVSGGDLQHAKKVAERLFAGWVYINKGVYEGKGVIPHVGAKQSGIGINGIDDYLQFRFIS